MSAPCLLLLIIKPSHYLLFQYLSYRPLVFISDPLMLSIQILRSWLLVSWMCSFTADLALPITLNVDHGSQNERPHDHECCHVHENKDQNQTHGTITNELLANKTSLLNGLLGNSFMVTSPYLSKSINWSEISCPNCSCLLGAYPHENLDGTLTNAPLNDTIHLFKCFISTFLPVGTSIDLFSQLENAKDELSFRTVRNLQTRCPMLQIVLINPNSWCSFGDCMDEMVQISKINMYPMIKVLFSDCSNKTESQLSNLNEWATKNQVEDVYMLMTKDLAESLELANTMLPPSHVSLKGLSLSFLRRGLYHCENESLRKSFVDFVSF
ncbi:hypothetical protein L1887_35839 [Cichorium endivia]|nr:hypothetical protein L1887_35839 [Cichorium endivia]